MLHGYGLGKYGIEAGYWHGDVGQGETNICIGLCGLEVLYQKICTFGVK